MNSHLNDISANKIAILIDGDNADSNLVEYYIAETGKFGRTTVKRIYADWTNPAMKNWKEKLNAFAIRPIQKFAYTSAKNSTDTALIIDAMDLLHNKLVQGVCIVSSDSDYTGLAHRIREQGVFVMGIGKSHTPEAFVKACEHFTYEEILKPAELSDDKDTNITKGTEEDLLKTSVEKLKGPKIIGKIDLNIIGTLRTSGIKIIDKKQIDDAFLMASDINTDLVLLSKFSDTLRKLDPSFDPRIYGHKSFRDFCFALKPHYQLVVHDDGCTYSLKKIE
jgi:uncharacterized LabA/DUF88 family protein